MSALSPAALHSATPGGSVGPLGVTALPPLPRSSDELPPAARRALTAGVLAAHVIGLWGLMQIDSVRNAVGEVAPMVVDMIAPPPPLPPPPPAPKPPPPQPVKLKTPPPPLVTAAPTTAPAPFVAPAPPPEPVVVAVAPEVPPAPTVAAPAPPSPPAPTVIRDSEAQYLTPPQVDYPPTSKRLGEAGLVVLRVVFDRLGVPKLVTLVKSSGHERLDRTAITAMRTARLKPYLVNGQPVEVEVASAPIIFDLKD
ncbi:MAG TPA: energy transducer TonB [Ideonella sp.]|nr:energy transducer TonB [Ideonella sp.]